MSPFDTARLVYTREPCARPFETDLWHHLQHGFVFSTPEGFVMGRPVRHDAPAAEILNPALTFSDPDCWHIWLAAGKWRELLVRHLPEMHEFISFERRNSLHIRRLKVLLDKVAFKLRCSSCSMNLGLSAGHITTPH